MVSAEIEVNINYSNIVENIKRTGLAAMLKKEGKKEYYIIKERN